MNSRFNRQDNHRLGFQNATLINLQMENKARQKDNTLILKEKDARSKFIEVVGKIRDGEIPQLKKSMIITNTTEENQNEVENKVENKVETQEQEEVKLSEIYNEKIEPEYHEMQFKIGEPKMKAVVDLAIKKFIREKSWK